MAELNWAHKIYRYRGEFLHKDELEEHSYVHRLLSGAEKWDDSNIEEGIPLYNEQIEAIRRQCDAEQKEEEKHEKDVKDLTQKVAGRQKAKLWVAKFQRPERFPRFSSWSGSQQRFVVDQLVRYWATGVPAHPAPAEARDVQRLMGFIENMRSEQEEFFAFARSVNASQLSRYNFIDKTIQQYMNRSLKTKMLRVKDYPPHYKEINMLPLAPPAGQAPNFSPLGEPLELGEVPVCVIPSMATYTDVTRQRNSLEGVFPSTGRQPNSGKKARRGGKFLYKEPVSADPNVRLLAAALDFGFVLTPSVLKTLLDNSAPQWDRQWEVPVAVEELPCRDGGTRRVVFLDKPLPPRSLSNMERNARAHKRIVRLLVCRRFFGKNVDYSWQPQHGEKRPAPANGKEKKAKKKKKKHKQTPAVAGDETSQPSAVNESPESAADMSTESAARPPPTDAEDSEASANSDDDQLRIDCNDEPETVQEGEQEQEQESTCAAEASDADGPSDSAASSGQTATGTDPEQCTTAGTDPEQRTAAGTDPEQCTTAGTDPEQCTTAGTDPEQRTAAGTDSEQRTVAGTDSEQRTVAGTDSEQRTGPGTAPEQRRQDSADPGFRRPPRGMNVHYRVWQLGGLRLLLRASTHGMRENPMVGLIRYTVHAKPAYQPAYGIEVMTRAEVVRQWLDCLVRPDSRVIRVHLDPVSTLVITPEERTLKQLTDELVKYDTGFRPPYGLQVLELILRELVDLPPGRYLLSHDARTGAFVRLSRADSAPGGMDLHSSFPSCPPVTPLKTPPCLNIDPSVLTPFNIRYGRVPALFDYDPRPGKGESGWKDYWAKLKEKGVTRKKKKKGKAKKKAEAACSQEDGASKAIVKHL